LERSERKASSIRRPGFVIFSTKALAKGLPSPWSPSSAILPRANTYAMIRRRHGEHLAVHEDDMGRYENPASRESARN
jgi:hypothetical protein